MILWWNGHGMLRKGWALSYCLSSHAEKELVRQYTRVSWITGSVILKYWKKLKGAALHSSVLSFNVFSQVILRCQLRGSWAGSYYRCRGTIPLHAIKHLPKEWQGISSHRPAATPSYWPLTHYTRYQRWDWGERNYMTSSTTDPSGMVPFSSVMHMTRAQRVKLLSVSLLIMLWSEVDAAETRVERTSAGSTVQHSAKLAKTGNMQECCRWGSGGWHIIAASKHSLAHQGDVKQVSMVSKNIQSIKQMWKKNKIRL